MIYTKKTSQTTDKGT